jgi:hypothetical protein
MDKGGNQSLVNSLRRITPNQQHLTGNIWRAIKLAICTCAFPALFSFALRWNILYNNYRSQLRMCFMRRPERPERAYCIDAVGG